MDFFQSHQTGKAVAILPSSIFPNVQLLVKRLVHQRAEIDRLHAGVTQGGILHWLLFPY
jgi:hypothetical protein